MEHLSKFLGRILAVAWQWRATWRILLKLHDLPRQPLPSEASDVLRQLKVRRTLEVLTAAHGFPSVCSDRTPVTIAKILQASKRDETLWSMNV